MKICTVCNNEFKSNRNTQKFCSVVCRNKYKNKNLLMLPSYLTKEQFEEVKRRALKFINKEFPKNVGD